MIRHGCCARGTGWRLVGLLGVVLGLALPAGAAEVLFVINPGTFDDADLAITTRLQDVLGHTVTTVDDDLCTTADAAGMDLVLISSSVLSGNVAEKYRDVSIGVIVWENGVYRSDRMAMATGGSHLSPYDTISIVNPAHPLAAGLPAGDVVVYTQGDRVCTVTAPLAPGAVVIANAPDGSPSLFALEAGAELLDGTTAAGRRVGSFIFDTSPAYLNEQGWQLVDAQIAWALVPEPTSLALLGLGGLALIRRRR